MNTFEERLLVELKNVVAERAEMAPSRRPRRNVRRFALAGGLVAAAAAIAVAVPPLLGEEDVAQANPVERRPDGTVVVHLREFTHPEQVEARLRKVGVPAQVNFLPSGKQCKEPRATFLDGRRTEGLFGDETSTPSNEVVIKPGLLKPGQTVVLDVWAKLKGDRVESSIVYPDVAVGQVGPCKPVGHGPVVGDDGVGDGPGSIEEERRRLPY
ncbi:hypothetical protein [Actinomadura macrotermitis]|uniref:Uncharacterized protein n=1 Tax=Actinomadura macrotermitis TaxID=2585200 RepID=A0A7K0BPT4_9ACTN|nr:hypothetical protein [Actinomadura macrotermitis]MQY03086.1 hypothetical protein [Actinomadura macrotermitis]